MQEHIRRAHPEHYISKLPATEESFLLMISTPPQDRRQNEGTPSATQSASKLPFPTTISRQNHRLTIGPKGFHDRHSFYRDESSNPGTPRPGDEKLPGTSSILGTASAAAVLAELHGVKSERELDMDGVSEEWLLSVPRCLSINRWDEYLIYYLTMIAPITGASPRCFAIAANAALFIALGILFRFGWPPQT